MERPQTSMTVQTEIAMTPLPPELDNNNTILYDVLDQDYEDVDDTDKVDENNSPMSLAQAARPRYHEQGPSIGASHRSLQPTYSEIGAPSFSKDIFANQSLPVTNQMTGYGKLDHSRPRQNYYPKKDSPLLSGYRKLEHIQAKIKATTLPHKAQPGYANIEIPGVHLRSISLPSSEYSNLNPSSPVGSHPSTPTHDNPQKKYANFEIIEAYDKMEHSPVIRQMSSDDYHMLADATGGQEDDMQRDYDFLPTYSCDGEPIEEFNFSLVYDLDKTIQQHRALCSLGRDPIGEQISVASTSQSSADFTGPFFFPHMVDFDASSTDSDNHTYRALDVSKMEPQQSYTKVSIKKNKRNFQ